MKAAESYICSMFLRGGPLESFNSSFLYLAKNLFASNIFGYAKALENQVVVLQNYGKSPEEVYS